MSAMLDLNVQQALDAEIRATLERLTTMPPILVQAYDDGAGAIKTWFYASPAEFAQLRLFDQADRIRLQAVCGTEVLRWSRAAASTKRVWQIRDRILREWKAAQVVAATTPPPGAELAEEEETAKKGKKAWKAPAQWVVEHHYRTLPDYPKLNTLVEQAEEAHSSVLGVLEGWNTVRRLLAAE